MGMPGERLSMRKIREVLRLRFAQRLSQRAIGISLRLSTGAVNTYLNRSRRAGLGWPLPDGLDDAQLETLLYPPPPAVAAEQRPVPDWAAVHRELRRPNMTLSLLWEEYRGGTGAQDGFGYSWFCDLYREWVGRLTCASPYASSASLATSSGRETSTRSLKVSGRADKAAVAPRLSSSTSASSTRMPRRAQAIARERPSPLPPPVTTAMRPAKSSMVSAPRTFAGESRARF